MEQHLIFNLRNIIKSIEKHPHKEGKEVVDKEIIYEAVEKAISYHLPEMKEMQLNIANLWIQFLNKRD